MLSREDLVVGEVLASQERIRTALLRLEVAVQKFEELPIVTVADIDAGRWHMENGQVVFDV